MFAEQSAAGASGPGCAPAAGDGSSRPVGPGGASGSPRELPNAGEAGSFGRESRLLTGRDFRYVFDRGVRSTDRCFSIVARTRSAGSDPCPARLGLAVARKQIRLAVRRNRLKRLIRESFRTHRERLSGMDVVVIPRAVADQVSREFVRSSLSRHWGVLAERCRRR